jgi:uncharacterized membrane protein YczE
VAPATVPAPSFPPREVCFEYSERPGSEVAHDLRHSGADYCIGCSPTGNVEVMGLPGSPTTYRLPTLGFRQQLRAGRLARRWLQLVMGLLVAALAIAMMVEARLGLDPWSVLHEGLMRHLGTSFGTVTVVSGIIVLLCWIPLRQPLGAGTIVNAVIIGGLIDLSLWAVPTPEELWVRVVYLVVGVVLCGTGAAVYLGSHLGPGPRDGLMTGLVERTGRSIRLVRTSLEASVLLVGFLLGGTVGVGTVLFAVAIGPMIQLLLPWVAAPLELPAED